MCLEYGARWVFIGLECFVTFVGWGEQVDYQVLPFCVTRIRVISIRLCFGAWWWLILAVWRRTRLGFDALYALIVDTGIDGMDFIFAPAPHG